MKIENSFEDITAPAYWASYLVNGDASGIDATEKAHADAWKERNKIVSVIDMARNGDGEAEDARFTKHYQLYDSLADCTGGDVLDYVCEVRS